jgi:hypothetical protein
MNEAARASQKHPPPDEAIGRMCSELWPDMIANGSFAACMRVLDSGIPERGVFEWLANQYFYLGALPSDARPAPGVDASMELWAKHNGCDPSFIEERVSPEVRKRSWPDCDATTILYIVDNGGHAWPGKPQPAFEAQFGHGTSDIDATNLLFEFFLR